jgi:hypothetical protein
MYWYPVQAQIMVSLIVFACNKMSYGFISRDTRIWLVLQTATSLKENFGVVKRKK